MKRKTIYILAGVVVFLVAVCLLGGPVALRLGLPVFCISTGQDGFKIDLCPGSPADLQVSEPLPLAATARSYIIDTDMAPDDWMAILYLLQHPDVDVKAITVAGTGEAHCAPGVANARGLTALAGRPEIPVACGSEAPLQGSHVFPDGWRERADNLLDLRLPENSLPADAGSAFELLQASLQAAPGKAVVVTLGPLTNLGELLQHNPNLAQKIEMIYVMGGAFDVPGNIAASNVGVQNAAAEWNIYIDPYALALVLQSGAPLTFVPLDGTASAPVTEDFLDRLKGDRSAPAAEFVYRLLDRQLDFIRSGGYYFWDPLTAAISADESLATLVDQRVTVVQSEGPESGATRISPDGSPVRIVTRADRQRYETLFLDVLNRRVR